MNHQASETDPLARGSEEPSVVFLCLAALFPTAPVPMGKGTKSTKGTKSGSYARFETGCSSNTTVGEPFEFQTGPLRIPAVRRQTYPVGTLGRQQHTSVGVRLVFPAVRFEIQNAHRPMHSIR